MVSCTVNEIQTDLGCIPTTVGGFVSIFFKIGLSLIGGVAIIYIIYGGYLLVVSQGDPTVIQNGKKYIFYAIIGLALAIFAGVILQIVAIDILHIPGFSR